MDAILHPAFQEEEIKKVTSRNRSDSARSIKDNPDAAAWEYYRSFFYLALPIRTAGLETN